MHDLARGTLTMRRRLVGAVMAAVAATGPLAAAAHDTWLSLHSAPSAGLLTLALSTGKQFPLQESGHRASSVVRSACLTADGSIHPLRPRQEVDQALLLRVRTERASGAALSCWAETKPLPVELAAAQVEEYLQEIQAPPEAVARWQAQRQQGVQWRESYSKTARIEHLADAAAPASAIAAVRKPTGRALELVLLGDEAVRVGSPLAIQVLEDGRPVAGLSVQLVNERFALGIWQSSDAHGKLRYPALPFGGRWLLRTTRLVPPGSAEGEWTSRFSTLLLQPLPKP